MSSTDLLFQTHVTLLAYRTSYLLNQLVIIGQHSPPTTAEVEQVIREAKEAANIAAQLGLLRQPAPLPIAPLAQRHQPFRSIAHVPAASSPIHPRLNRRLLTEFDISDHPNNIRRTGRSNRNIHLQRLPAESPSSEEEEEEEIEDGEIRATPESQRRPPSYRSPSPEY